MNLTGKIHVLYRCRMCPSLYSNVEQALGCCQNVSTAITGKISPKEKSKEEGKKLKEDVNKSKDINKSKEDIHIFLYKSKEDENKSKEDENKSKEDEKISKEDENISKEDEQILKENTNKSKDVNKSNNNVSKLKADENKSNNNVSKLKADENKSRADENRPKEDANKSEADVNKSKGEEKKIKVEKKSKEGERLLFLKLDESPQEDETSTESAEESTPEEDEEVAARLDGEKDDGVPILKELTIQGGSSIHQNKSGRGGYRVPIWKRKEVDILIQMLKENYWRFDHGDGKDSMWREITAEISKSNPTITLKQVVNKWYGIKRRFREYHFNQTQKCPRWYETVSTFCNVEPCTTKKTNDADLDVLPSLDFEINMPGLMESDSGTPDTHSQNPDTPERKKQSALQNIIELENLTSSPGERHKFISSLFKRKQNDSSEKEKQGIELTPKKPPRKRRRTTVVVSQTNQLLKEILEETRRHNLEVETHNTNLRQMFASVVAAMNQKNVLLKEVVDQNSSGA